MTKETAIGEDKSLQILDEMSSILQAESREMLSRISQEVYQEITKWEREQREAFDPAI